MLVDWSPMHPYVLFSKWHYIRVALLGVTHFNAHHSLDQHGWRLGINVLPGIQLYSLLLTKEQSNNVRAGQILISYNLCFVADKKKIQDRQFWLYILSNFALFYSCHICWMWCWCDTHWLIQVYSSWDNKEQSPCTTECSCQFSVVFSLWEPGVRAIKRPVQN